MATNLKERGGHQLVVYDVNPAATKSIASATGANVAKNPADVAAQVDYLLTMVPTPAHVRQVYLGDDGIISGGRANANIVLLDSSTIDPETSREVHKEATAKGLKFVDAPVSGAVPAARAATLTFMVGGDKAIVDQARDILLSMGKNVVHTGDIGTGVIAKLCNNMMLAISMIGTAETLNLGHRMGLDPALLTKILNISSGRTWVSEIYNPVPGLGDDKLPANHDYANGFGVNLIAKDLVLAQSIAVASQSPTPMGALASQVYSMMKNNQAGDKDFSFVYQFLKQKWFNFLKFKIKILSE